MKGCVIQFQETCNQEGCLKKKIRDMEKNRRSAIGQEKLQQDTTFINFIEETFCGLVSFSNLSEYEMHTSSHNLEETTNYNQIYNSENMDEIKNKYA